MHMQFLCTKLIPVPLLVFLLALLPTFSASLPLALSSELTNNHQPTTNNRCVDCAIIGGGPAGLATSIAISKASPSSIISIYEQDAFEPKGASIQISRSGFDSIKQLDASIIPKLEAASVPVTDVETKSWAGDDKDNAQQTAAVVVNQQPRGIGSTLKRVSTKVKKMVFRAVLNRIHLWHDVRIIFANQACEVYANNQDAHGDTEPLLNTNFKLIGIRPLMEGEDLFELTFQHTTSGEEMTVRTKYLFACDGTKSRVRALLPNEPVILLSENKSVWRGMAPHFNAKGRATFYRGRVDDSTAGRSALVFPGGKGAGSSWTVISDIEDGKSESIEEAKARVLKVVQTMGTENCNLLTKIIHDSNVVVENKLHVRDFDKPWESSYEGVIYLGDAAHPVRPTGQGAALAFEDAAVLYRVIVEQGGLSVKALRKYESERFLPVKEVSEAIRTRADAFYKPKR